MFCPAWKFRFEVLVLAIPDGHTVMYPAVCGDTTVTFNTTAATPVAGTPPSTGDLHGNCSQGRDRAGDLLVHSGVRDPRGGQRDERRTSRHRRAGQSRRNR